MNKNTNKPNLKFISNLIQINKKIRLIIKNKYTNLKLSIRINSFIIPDINNINIPTDSCNEPNNIINDIDSLFTNIVDGVDSFIGDIGNDFGNFDGFDNSNNGGDGGGCIF